MITLYGFGRVHDKVIGETRDLRVRWALEETGLPYCVHGLDHTGGEHFNDLCPARGSQDRLAQIVPVLHRLLQSRAGATCLDTRSSYVRANAR